MMDIPNVFYRSFVFGVDVDGTPYEIFSIILIISKYPATQKNSVFIMYHQSPNRKTAIIE